MSAAPAKTKSATQLVTGVVRVSFPHVWEPHSNNADQPPKYSLKALLPKTDVKAYEALRAIQKVALEEGKTKFGGKIPARWVDTIHDGDDSDHDRYPEDAGHWTFSVTAKNPPGVVDINKDPILDKTEIYSGVYARLQIGAFAFNTNGNKGVSFGLNHIQKIRDGEFLGGRTRAEDAFDDDFKDEDSDLI